MLFSSITFLYWFLPCTLLLYFLVPKCLKNTVLLLASLLFYAWGEPKYAVLMVLTILYIDNRYSCQQELIEIDRLRKELTDIKYDALTRSSELMEKSRQSRIEEYISAEESHLETSTNRPYLIRKD